jgi:mevalonate kinase
MMNRDGFAHGKVILFGEHAVVHGAPALAVGIDRGVRVSASPRESGAPTTLRIRSSASLRRLRGGREVDGTVVADENGEGAARALAAMLAVTRAGGVTLGPVALDAEIDLPPGGGLGCSAALGVAVARALDPEALPLAVAERAGAWEGVFHGNPSGVDAVVAALGGCVLFERAVGGGFPTIARVRSPGQMILCVGDTGNPASTRSMVESVARIRERRPEATQRTFDAIATLVKNARLAIEAADRRAIGQLLDLNQMLLAGLFVSTAEIEQMCAAARRVGALGAKLTGAGGGGCVIALVDTSDVAEKVLAAWRSDGFDGFATAFGGASPVRREPAPLEETA